MALPRLNESPQYTMTIPSTGEEIKYRPFLVKEQKILLMAQESQDPKQIMTSLLTCIENCTQGLDVSNLATFDADYMFSQIRSKSVGESTSLIGVCQECEHENTVSIKLDTISVSIDPEASKDITLTPEITLRMKYPSYNDFVAADVLKEENTATEILLNTVIACMDSIMTQDDNILVRDESREEIEEFLNSLTSDQFDMVAGFVRSIPKMYHREEYKCEECGTDNELVLEGLSDFFS